MSAEVFSLKMFRVFGEFFDGFLFISSKPQTSKTSEMSCFSILIFFHTVPLIKLYCLINWICEAHP